MLRQNMTVNISVSLPLDPAAKTERNRSSLSRSTYITQILQTSYKQQESKGETKH